MDWQIGNPTYGYLALLSLITIGLAVYAYFARQRGVAKFLPSNHPDAANSSAREWKMAISTTLATGSLLFLVLALIDFRWGKTQQEVPQKGIEVMFALDVSRSMLAQDAAPNRLKRAKQQIKDMLDQMAGDRVGLVIFAGETRQVVPLTNHYEDFKQALDAVTPDSVVLGGSKLGDALRAAAEGFIDKTNDFRTIVLFTDGEDQESQPVEIARRLHADHGTRVFTIGLGDLEQGARIPDNQSNDQFVEYQGQPVWSKLNGQILKQLATETDGAYIPAGTKRVDMGSVYRRYIASVEQTEFESAVLDVYTPRFQWFAAAALLLLLAEILLQYGWIATAAKTNAPESSRSMPSSMSRQGRSSAAAILMALMISLPAAAQESSFAEQMNRAGALLRDNQYAEAIEEYRKLNPATELARDQRDFNLGVAHYRNNDLDAAESAFSQAARSSNSRLAADSRYNLGNCHYSEALADQENNPSSAIEQLDQAITHYRSALRLDPQLDDARANLELAAKLRAQLKEREEEKQEQDQPNQDAENDSQQDQQQQDQQQQDQQQPSNAEEQPQPEDQQRESSDSADQDQPSEEPQSPDSEQQSPDQESSESTDQQSTSDPQSQPAEAKPDTPSDNEEQQPEPSSQTNPRDDASPSPDSNQPPTDSDDAGPQPEPNEAKVPEGELTANNESNTEPPTSQQVLQNAAADGKITREEALKMLQAVRDRDMLRRLRQQRQQRNRRIPVEKDW